MNRFWWLGSAGRTALCGAISGGGLLSASPASAEDQSEPKPSDNSRGAQRPTDNSGEIIITAQKREQRLKDVPISIIAMKGDELKAREIHNIDDLSLAVPNLEIESSGLQRIIEIRGISNGN